MEIISLHSVKPASYNPRTLKDDAKEELKRSLRELGCIKPIISLVGFVVKNEEMPVRSCPGT